MWISYGYTGSFNYSKYLCHQSIIKPRPTWHRPMAHQILNNAYCWYKLFQCLAGMFVPFYRHYYHYGHCCHSCIPLQTCFYLFIHLDVPILPKGWRNDHIPTSVWAIVRSEQTPLMMSVWQLLGFSLLDTVTEYRLRVF